MPHFAAVLLAAKRGGPDESRPMRLRAGNPVRLAPKIKPASCYGLLVVDSEANPMPAMRHGWQVTAAAAEGFAESDRRVASRLDGSS